MQLGEGENKTPKSMPVPVSAPVPTSVPRAHLRPYLHLARCLYLHMHLHLYSAFEPAISTTNVVGIVGGERLQLCCGSGKEL